MTDRYQKIRAALAMRPTFDWRARTLIHALAVAIVSALAWWHHDPALVLAYVSGALIEWEVNHPPTKVGGLKE